MQAKRIIALKFSHPNPQRRALIQCQVCLANGWRNFPLADLSYRLQNSPSPLYRLPTYLPSMATFHFFLPSTLKYVCLVTQSCPTLCDLKDCGPPGSSVHGSLQARILEWVAKPSSRGSSQSRDQTQVSGIAGGFFTV